ncbi:MAG TPA: squalene synthase HpnC, partial [Jatrophihabitantaceae bacterium]
TVAATIDVVGHRTIADIDTDELARLAAGTAAQMGSENFPVALRFLPPGPRTALTRLYAYARFVDDVGDEAAGDRLALLRRVEDDVRALAGAGAQLPPVAGLAPLVRDYGVPLEPFLDLVEANRRDQLVHRYETFADLLDYCRYSAAPVGRVVLYIAGAPGKETFALSDAICNGLQVLEHCQDVGEDARAGRVYLPAEDLAAHGVADADLLAHTTPAGLREVVATQVDRAEGLLQQGRPLVRRLHGWARLAVAGYLAGGRATVTQLRHAGHDVLGQTVRPGKIRTAAQVVRLMVGR